MKKHKPITVHPDLFRIMRKQGFTNENMAAMVGLSAASFSLRKHGVINWELDKCYRILDILNIPRTELPRYFSGSDGNFEEPEDAEIYLEEIVILEQAALDRLQKLKQKLGGINS